MMMSSEVFWAHATGDGAGNAILNTPAAMHEANQIATTQSGQIVRR
jgi:hypothetical protein